MIKIGFGEDSHRFASRDSKKELVLAGVMIAGETGLEGNSDADVVLHALTNAVSGVSCVNILGKTADAMCRDRGIRDSSAYLVAALETLGSFRVVHVSVSIEALYPVLAAYIPQMRQSIARLCRIGTGDVGITATTGEGLTAFGRGEGIRASAIITAQRIQSGEGNVGSEV